MVQEFLAISRKEKKQLLEAAIHSRIPLYIKIIFSFFLLPKKKPLHFIRVSLLVTIQFHFSKPHFPDEIFFSQKVWSILCLFPHLLAYHTGRKSISSALEKLLTTMYSRYPYSESPGGVRLVSSSSRCSTRGVTTTAGGRTAPGRKLLCLSQRRQLQEHCCLGRYWAVPPPAVLHWTLLNEMKEDCWQHGDTNVGRLTTTSCLYTPLIGLSVLPLTLSSFLWLWVMSVSTHNYFNISFS